MDGTSSLKAKDVTHKSNIIYAITSNKNQKPRMEYPVWNTPLKSSQFSLDFCCTGHAAGTPMRLTIRQFKPDLALERKCSEY
jgi:hypothetical protein